MKSVEEVLEAIVKAVQAETLEIWTEAETGRAEAAGGRALALSDHVTGLYHRWKMSQEAGGEYNLAGLRVDLLREHSEYEGGE